MWFLMVKISINITLDVIMLEIMEPHFRGVIVVLFSCCCS